MLLQNGVHPGSFRWGEIKDLEHTENERVRKLLKTKTGKSVGSAEKK